MKFEAEDERFLIGAITRGEVIPVLGAGASVTSVNSKGEKVKSGLRLAEALADRAGLEFQGESLGDVFEAVKGDCLSDVQIRAFLKEEYSGVTPSEELTSLFGYAWKRLYTFNIDDAVDNVPSNRSAQRRRYFNGMVDKVADYEPLSYLHVIHLHGQAIKPEHGFIFSESDYAAALRSEKHFWYLRAAQDYFAYCPVFIGSQFNEPILQAQIERAKREQDSVTGKAFLIVPDNLTPIRVASLKKRGIVYVRGTLEDFVKWLGQKFPGGLTVDKVVSSRTTLSLDNVSISQADLDAAAALKPIETDRIRRQLLQVSPAKFRHMGRYFLTGFSPTDLSPKFHPGESRVCS